MACALLAEVLSIRSSNHAYREHLWMNRSPGLIIPGATTVISSSDIANYDRSYDLIVSVLRVRRGFLFKANSFFLSPTNVRSSGARVVLRSGRYFPTVLP